MENARRAFPTLRYAESIDEALRAADCVVLATEWEEFRQLDPIRAGGLVRSRVILDGRNVLDPQAWQSAGWEITALGRTF